VVLGPPSRRRLHTASARQVALTLGLVLWLPAAAAAEWQVRPFIGFAFGGSTTFVDPEDAVREKYLVLGASGGWLGEVFGFEADFTRAAGFFDRDDRDLLIDSGVHTLTGNVVIALPRRMAQYSLRPSFVGGAGLMHVKVQAQFGAVDISRTMPAMNLGGGVTGFVNDRVGVNWEVRRFRTLDRSGDEVQGDSFGDERLSFWRLTMSVAFRY
jgi:hypothetical protein